MEIKNPIVIRMAMLLEELEMESQRAAYMVISDMHRLQEAVRSAKGSPTMNDTIKIDQKQPKKGKR